MTLRVTSDGNHIAGRASKNGKTMKGVKVNLDDLRIFGYKCFATFAGDKGELIVLLDEFPEPVEE